MFKEVGKMLGDLQIENSKLKQTLAEIKEIAEGCQYGDCHECKYQPRTDCRTELVVQILQKISEWEETDVR